jgi:hypothetical protein
MTYEEWSEKNPIKWDEIEDTEDCLITKTGVEMFHYQTYLLECKKTDELNPKLIELEAL